MWLFRYTLNGQYKQEKWQTQEGAIARRDALLRSRRVRQHDSSYKVIAQTGWTAITRFMERNRNDD